VSERKVGSVTYQEVGKEYFEQRGLRRHAGVWSLWALGVAAVISGDFFGWNLGLLTGGFGGLAIATVIITVMYIGLCYSIAEMSPALPHTGGAYSFGRSAMGPWGGFITGLAENMEYVVTPAVVVVAIGAYMNAITIELFDLDVPLQIWWAIAYAIFLGLNIAGIETTMRFTVVICFMSLAILAFFFVAALTDFSVDNLTNIPPEAGNSEWLPFGVSGIFKNLPFAIWFYLAIEELPLAAEESMDPKRDIPKATMWGLWTLVIFGVGTLILNTGVPGHLRRRHGGRAAGADRRRGARRELPHDHLRVRPEHLLAVAGRLLPEVDVEDPRDAQEPVRRPPAGRDRRVRHRVVDQRVHRDEHGRRAADDGRVRGRDLVLHADALLHHPEAQAAGHRPSVPQPGRDLGGGDRRGHRARLAGLALP
jgi:hypothetical protein